MKDAYTCGHRARMTDADGGRGWWTRAHVNTAFVFLFFTVYFVRGMMANADLYIYIIARENVFVSPV